MTIEAKIREIREREQLESIPNEIELEINNYILTTNRMPTDLEIFAFKFAYRRAREARMDAIQKMLEESGKLFKARIDALTETLRKRDQE